MFIVFDLVSILLNFLHLSHTDTQSFLKMDGINLSPLSDRSLQMVHQSHTAEQLKNIFDKINVIRPVDSEAHHTVGQSISGHFRSLNWSVEWDNFTENTVIGRKTFRNIITTLGPPELDYLVLACHYDSKLIAGFYGSIDSAMPCSIMMRIADAITAAYRRQVRHPYTLKMIFFDGEESFKEWSRTDSLYGSRHLAIKWNQLDSKGERELSKIKLFVLLDLIGSRGITIPSYPKGKHDMYAELVSLEHRLANASLLHAYQSFGHRYFRGYSQHRIEDDQIPFLELGVPVLHLIPIPFPWVWHSVHDNAENIDWHASMDFLRLLDAFVRSILHLNEHD